MVNEQKTSVLSVRIRPSVRALIERMAAEDQRSLAQMLEISIQNEAARREKKPKKT